MTHQGPGSIHAGEKRVDPLSPDGANGPCLFLEKRGGRWIEAGREIHLGILESR